MFGDVEGKIKDMTQAVTALSQNVEVLTEVLRAVHVECELLREELSRQRKDLRDSRS